MEKENKTGIQELKNEQTGLQEVIEKKKDDLERRDDGEQIPEEEYKNLVYSEEQYNSWKTQLKQAVKDYNHANQTQAELEKEIGSCTTSIQFYTENLKRQTGIMTEMNCIQPMSLQFLNHIKLMINAAMNSSRKGGENERL